MGIQPSEFWNMTLPEFFVEVYAVNDGPKGPGLTDDDREHFLAWLDGGDE